MTDPMLLLASVNGLIGLVFAFALTRRYGWKPALGLPLAAFVAFLAVLWQSQGASVSEALQLAPQLLVFASPTLVGALLGVGLARGKR